MLVFPLENGPRATPQLSQRTHPCEISARVFFVLLPTMPRLGSDARPQPVRAGVVHASVCKALHANRIQCACRGVGIRRRHPGRTEPGGRIPPFARGSTRLCGGPRCHFGVRSGGDRGPAAQIQKPTLFSRRTGAPAATPHGQRGSMMGVRMRLEGVHGFLPVEASAYLTSTVQGNLEYTHKVIRPSY